jgi:hypothetical protein
MQTVVSVCSHHNPPQVALFVEEMCDPGDDMSSAVSVQMFLACRGIQLLIQLLRPSDVKPALDDGPVWEQEYQITLLSLTCITRLFHFQVSARCVVALPFRTCSVTSRLPSGKHPAEDEICDKERDLPPSAA